MVWNEQNENKIHKIVLKDFEIKNIKEIKILAI